MKTISSFSQIECNFNEEEKAIMWLIKEFLRRYNRKYHTLKNKIIILRWFVYAKNDPRTEKNWKIMSKVYHRLKEHKVDIDKYLTYVFGHEKDIKFYYLASAPSIRAYKSHQRQEYTSKDNFLDGERKMIEKLIAVRKFNNELELFQNVPAIMFNLSQEYLIQSDAYKVLREGEWFKEKQVRDPLSGVEKKSIKNILK